MTIAIDPKIVALVVKLVIIGGLTILEAIEETSNRTGIPKSVIKNMINKKWYF